VTPAFTVLAVAELERLVTPLKRFLASGGLRIDGGDHHGA